MLNNPRITTWASGVTMRSASSARQTARSARRSPSSAKLMAAGLDQLLHGANLLDVGRPVREVLRDLRQHRRAERLDVEPVFLLDEDHPLGFEVLPVARGALAVPVEGLPA